MSDLARWELRGPVRNLRTRVAEWNPEAGDWWPSKDRSAVTFRPDGQQVSADHHNPDGSVPRDVKVYDADGRLTEDQSWLSGQLTGRVLHTYDNAGRPVSCVSVGLDGTHRETELCRYDERGRKTKIVFLAEPESGDTSCLDGSCASMTMYGVADTDTAYSAPGATTMTTVYDENERPSMVTFHDANHAIVSRVVFDRDHEGRVLSERMEFADTTRFFGRDTDIENMPADKRESLMTLLTTAFEDHAFSLSTYTYDEQGRRVETIRRMG